MSRTPHLEIDLHGFRVTAALYGPTAEMICAFGELDILTAPAFAVALEATVASQHRAVVLDLAGVSFFGVSGIGVLDRARQDIEAYGGRIAVRGASPHVRRLLEIGGLGHLLLGAASGRPTPNASASLPVEPAPTTAPLGAMPDRKAV
jgi:anti-anti-sigma factor